MFTVKEREGLRDALVSAARADGRVTGAALLGSGALGHEDRWSDIDLALCVPDDAARELVVADWTERMYREEGAVHHLDVNRAGTLYRVFLLASTLQVDVSFWRADRFGATGPAFQLLFGAIGRPPTDTAERPADLIGLGWLYALHARSSIARGRRWQAEYMLSGARDQVLALKCVRHGLPAVQARGTDDLPAEETLPLTASLVRGLDVAELRVALSALIEALLDEAVQVDSELARALAGPLRELAVAP